MHQEYDLLLARYFDGSATPTDMQALEQWLAQSDEHEAYFAQMSTLYEQIGLAQHATLPQPKVREAKAAFIAHMQQPATVARPIWQRRRVRQWVAVAAGIALLIGIGGLLHSPSHTHTLGNMAIRSSYTLPDHTQVQLEANSSLTYNDNYAKGKRSLSLVGQATFAVQPGAQGTLVVQAGETFIKDIGTVFTVVAYPDSSWVQIQVQEGEVLFYTKANKGISLVAGQTGIYHKHTKTFVRQVPIPDTMGRKPVPLVFNGTPLHEVIALLNARYGVDISVDQDSMGLQQISVSFEGEEPEIMLEIISETLSLDLKKEGNKYILSNPNAHPAP